MQQELADGPFVRRYRVDEADDGLEGEEGAFYILSFGSSGRSSWIGETEEALAHFEKVYETASPLGLFAEMHDSGQRARAGQLPASVQPHRIRAHRPQHQRTAAPHEYEEELLA